MLKRFLITFCIAASIVIIFSVIVTKKREERRTLEAKQKYLAEKIDDLKKGNDKLRLKKEALVNDPIEIEREARESHGYIKPGEVTYKKYNFDIKEPQNEEVEQTSVLNRLNSFLFDGPFPWQVPLGLILIATIFLIFSYRHEGKRLHRQDRE